MFSAVLLFAAAALAVVPPVPRRLEDVPAYVKRHGQELAESFAAHRTQGKGLTPEGVQNTAAALLANMAGQPLLRQHEKLLAMHDRISKRVGPGGGQRHVLDPELRRRRDRASEQQ